MSDTAWNLPPYSEQGYDSEEQDAIREHANRFVPCKVCGDPAPRLGPYAGHCEKHRKPHYKKAKAKKPAKPQPPAEPEPPAETPKANGTVDQAQAELIAAIRAEVTAELRDRILEALR